MSAMTNITRAHKIAAWMGDCIGLDQRGYSTLGPVSARMGDHLRAGKLSQYVTSHPGQLSLAIPLWVGAMSTSLGWEGNRRSGVALAMRQTIAVYPPTGSNGL